MTDIVVDHSLIAERDKLREKIDGLLKDNEYDTLASLYLCDREKELKYPDDSTYNQRREIDDKRTANKRMAVDLEYRMNSRIGEIKRLSAKIDSVKDRIDAESETIAILFAEGNNPIINDALEEISHQPAGNIRLREMVSLLKDKQEQYSGAYKRLKKRVDIILLKLPGDFYTSDNVRQGRTFSQKELVENIGKIVDMCIEVELICEKYNEYDQEKYEDRWEHVSAIEEECRIIYFDTIKRFGDI